MKKRVLIVTTFLGVRGGGSAVCAWAIEALREDYQVCVSALEPADCAALNRFYGTSLRDQDFQQIVAPQRYRRLRRWMPTQGALLDRCLAMRWAQSLDRKNRYDLMLGTQDEMDFGRRGIQYVHNSWTYDPSARGDMRWFHYIPAVLQLYQRCCGSIARVSNEGLRANLSLTNSNFMRDRIRRMHGVDATLLYPPVPGGFAALPWEQRQKSFVGLGRLADAKRWGLALEILEEVRRRGFDVTFTLIGRGDDSACSQHLRARAAGSPWFRLAETLTRAELVQEVPRHRYGIHAMEDEHFGIGPAEIQRAGCILFAHNSGGPREIVDDPRRLFDTVEDAADKIERMLKDPALEEDFRRRTIGQQVRFTEAAFIGGLREIVARFI